MIPMALWRAEPASDPPSHGGLGGHFCGAVEGCDESVRFQIARDAGQNSER